MAITKEQKRVLRWALNRVEQEQKYCQQVVAYCLEDKNYSLLSAHTHSAPRLGIVADTIRHAINHPEEANWEIRK